MIPMSTTCHMSHDNHSLYTDFSILQTPTVATSRLQNTYGLHTEGVSHFEARTPRRMRPTNTLIAEKEDILIQVPPL
jgi:hypothetical protein